MSISNREHTTSTLWEMLLKAPSADMYIDEHSRDMTLMPFHLYITSLCRRRGEAPDRVIRRANIEKSFSVLTTCPRLTVIELGRTLISGLIDIPTLPALTRLSLRYCLFSNLTGIERCPNWSTFVLRESV